MTHAGLEELSAHYDNVPYASHPFPQSAPEHLQAVAALFGLESPPLESARFLELGCAAGGNLLPLAARYPGAHAIGVDLSQVQVENGKALLLKAGLKNVEFRHMDLSEIDRSFGTFDYIICHGVYSWVPESVRHAILRIACQNLSENGLAYISYNVYPGWKSREIARDAMMLRGGSRNSAEKLPYARGMLDFLRATVRPESVLKAALDEVQPIIANFSDYYLLHEFLEPFNAPCYFRDFLAAAEEAGLSYVAEAEPLIMFVQNYGTAVSEPLLKEFGSSQVAIEQYLDFVSNRTFRQTILSHKARAGDIRRRIGPDILDGLHFSGVFTSEDGPLTLDQRPQPCRLLRNTSLVLTQPAIKAVAQALNAAFPATLSVEELINYAVERLTLKRSNIRSQILAFLEDLTIKGQLRFRKTASDVAPTVPARPFMPAALAATLVPTNGGKATLACNLLHETISLNIVEARLAVLLDGTRDVEALIVCITEAAQAGLITFLDQGAPITRPEAILAAAREHVPLALKGLRSKGCISRKGAAAREHDRF